MIVREPSYFLGKYFNVYPAVVSVFTIPNPRLRLLLRRYFPFLVTGYADDAFSAINTATNHNLTVSMDEIVACRGEKDAMANYMNPLSLRLNSQICWDASRLWRQPLQSFSDLGPRGHLVVPRQRSAY